MPYPTFPTFPPPLPPSAFQPAFQYPAFEGRSDPALEYGYAIITPLAQFGGLQPEAPAYLAGSACRVMLQYFDTEDNAFVPYAVQYRIDDYPSAENVVAWTNVPVVAQTNTIVVPAASNGMISYSRNFETRKITVEVADWEGNSFLAEASYELLRRLGGLQILSTGYQSGAFQTHAFQTGDTFYS